MLDPSDPFTRGRRRALLGLSRLDPARAERARCLRTDTRECNRDENLPGQPDSVLARWVVPKLDDAGLVLRRDGAAAGAGCTAKGTPQAIVFATGTLPTGALASHSLSIPHLGNGAVEPAERDPRIDPGKPVEEAHCGARAGKRCSYRGQIRGTPQMECT